LQIHSKKWTVHTQTHCGFHETRFNSFTVQLSKIMLRFKIVLFHDSENIFYGMIVMFVQIVWNKQIVALGSFVSPNRNCRMLKMWVTRPKENVSLLHFLFAQKNLTSQNLLSRLCCRTLLQPVWTVLGLMWQRHVGSTSTQKKTWTSCARVTVLWGRQGCTWIQ